MNKEPEPMREIHEIRVNLYKENKNLSHQEHIAKVHKEAEEIIKKYRLKVRIPSEIGNKY
jgi:hypothetical protein